MSVDDEDLVGVSACSVIAVSAVLVVVCGPAGAVESAFGRLPGGEFELAALVRHQSGSGEGVVLFRETHSCAALCARVAFGFGLPSTTALICRCRLVPTGEERGRLLVGGGAAGDRND